MRFWVCCDSLFLRGIVTDLCTGRKEIWDALKAAATALESGDSSLAQAIIDGANIALPHGNYDAEEIIFCYMFWFNFWVSDYSIENFQTESIGSVYTVGLI